MPGKKPRKGMKSASEPALARIGGGEGDDDLHAAQQIIYDAWEMRDRRDRVALARKALAVSSLCADAYVLLAENATTAGESMALYRQGVVAGEQALGTAAFEDDVGHFWGLLETRPYMRARHGLALVSWRMGERDEAVLHYQDMLRLNPGDNQGIRYTLLDALLELGRDGDAGKLIKRYKDDGAAAWSWSGALLSFRTDGDGAASRRALAGAVKANAHVPSYLLGKKKLPRTLPEFIGLGDTNEAVVYVHGAVGAWARTAGALAWARKALADRPARAGVSSG